MNDSDEVFSADVAENHEVLTKSTVSKIFGDSMQPYSLIQTYSQHWTKYSAQQPKSV